MHTAGSCELLRNSIPISFSTISTLTTYESAHHIPGGGDMLCLAGVRWCYYPQPVLFTFPANPELQLMRQERERVTM